MTTPINRFAERMNIRPGQAQHLRNLVNIAADAQVAEHNDGSAADRACSQVDNYARRLGLGTDWRPGIYPLITFGELSEHIPD